MQNKISVWKSIWRGHSVTRAFLNQRLAKESLSGKTIDIGGGHDADYIQFMPRNENVTFETFDVKAGAQIDFETESLPSLNDSYDTVIFLNVMEHIFNHQHIANEVVRIVKSGGQVIGFVPFLMWYHPDHRDFFRYTHEALEIIFKKAGGKNITVEPIFFGPGTAAAHMLLQSFPRIVRVPIFSIFYLFDVVYRALRMNRANVFALGYFFKVSK